MVKNKKKDQLFVDYFDEWIETYKVGAIRDVTLRKYYIASVFLRKQIPRVFIDELDRRVYQNLLNEYAKTHEKQTTTDFHHQVKSCIKDAFHDGLIERDPTYKAIVKGKAPAVKKIKYLSKEELSKFLAELDLKNSSNTDWLILLVAKTGLRFAEALGITPTDFDFSAGTLTINKTWRYKNSDGQFDLTKNESSVRTIMIDWQIITKFSRLIDGLSSDEPIFIGKVEDGKYKRIFNSTYNNRMSVLCKKAGVPEITIHGLRHTHASVLLASEVSIQTIAKRLGHSNTSTTQETYLHIIKELEQKDEQKMMSALSSIA